MAQYVRGDQTPADPAASPLGEDNTLFLVSYALSESLHPNADSIFHHFANPDIDLIDAHMYTWPLLSDTGDADYRMALNFDKVQALHDDFPTLNAPFEDRKPVTAGEVNYWTQLQFGTWDNQIEKVFHNYDVSFHNELWSGAFSGKFATGMMWWWERVFWWDGSLVKPPDDDDPQFGNLWQTTFSNALGAINVLDLGAFGADSLENKPAYHNFKPLAEMLNNPDLQASEFFNWDFAPYMVYDTTGQLECYYLMNSSGTMAIGWVHNLNAWGMNNFYLKKAVNNFLGCTTPDSQTVRLPGFAYDHDFYITYFPTRIGGPVPPNDTVVSVLDTVTLDLSGLPFNGLSNNFLDTLHSDYGFVIAPYPVQRSMAAYDEPDTTEVGQDWDFSIFPNPASDELHLILATDDVRRNIDLFDLSGRLVYSKKGVKSRLFDIPIVALAKGTYCVRVSDATRNKMKVFVIN